MVSPAGEAVSRFSTTQFCEILTTTESEYVALADVTQEVVIPKGLLEFLEPGQPLF